MTACSCGDRPFASVLQVVVGDGGRRSGGATEEKVVTVVGEYEEEEREPKNKNIRKETAHLGNSGNTQPSTGAKFKAIVVHDISC